jgi:ATP-binding cassette subfamily B protein
LSEGKHRRGQPQARVHQTAPIPIPVLEEPAEPEGPDPSVAGESAGEKVLPQLLSWLRPDRPRLVLVTVLGVAAVALNVAGPQILGDATNVLFAGLAGQRFHSGQTKAQAIAGLREHGHSQLADLFRAVNFVPGTGVDFTHLGQLLGLAALAYTLAATTGWLQSRILVGIVQRAVFRFRQAVEEKLARLPLAYFDSHTHGDLLSLVTNDVDNIYTSLQEGLSPVLTSLLTVLGILGMMFYISPLLAAASLVTIPLSVVVAALFARRSKPLFDSQWEQTAKLNGMIEETHSGHALVMAFGQRQATTDDFARLNNRLYRVNFPAVVMSAVVLPVVQFIGNINYVVIAALGGFQIASGVISFGAVQAFIQYSRRFAIPVSQVAGQLSLMQSGLASMRRVFSFLSVPEEPELPALPAVNGTSLPSQTSGTPLPSRIYGRLIRPTEPDGFPAVPGRVNGPPAVHAIQLSNVSFRYDPDTPLIEDFSLDAHPGQTVAIVGPTGAGKTTVVNLLMRFYEIDSGHIYLDGVDYRDLSREEVRRCFGMVLQDTWLFGGTIRDNIAYGREGARDTEIIAAARAAYVDDFVRTLPDGYATVLDAEASTISAGQKQLLTIARAFLADPGVLILDEATSNVDTRTEVLIRAAMARLRARRTSFVIAHRLSTIRDADCIVVMKAGQVIEQGSHEELLARRGLYLDLYNSQFTSIMARSDQGAPVGTSPE